MVNTRSNPFGLRLKRTCACPDRRFWYVVNRYCNYSAFAGHRRTPSRYSSVTCVSCGRIWRTCAGYVPDLLDVPAGWASMAPGVEGRVPPVPDPFYAAAERIGDDVLADPAPDPFLLGNALCAALEAPLPALARRILARADELGYGRVVRRAGEGARSPAEVRRLAALDARHA